MAERRVGRRPEGEEQAGRETRRAPGVGLRLPVVGQHGVEDVGAEGSLGDVAGGLVLVAEQAVQPAVGLAALGEVVDQLHVAPPPISQGGLGAVDEVVDVHQGGVVARQLAEPLGTDLPAVGIVGVEGQRQIGLAGRHRRRQGQRAEASARQDRRRQNEALAEQVGELGNARVGLEVDALDVGMGDAPAWRVHGAVGDHFVARAHEVLAGLHLDLLRPARLGQQLGGVDGQRPEGRNLAVQPGYLRLAHEVEADAAGGYRRWVAVLHPEQHLLAVPGRRQAAVEVGRPGVGVVGAGQHLVAVAVGVEGVLDDVMSGDAADVQEETPGEGAEAEAFAHVLGVDHHAAIGAGQRIAPLGQGIAVFVHQAAPGFRRLGAVA